MLSDKQFITFVQLPLQS